VGCKDHVGKGPGDRALDRFQTYFFPQQPHVVTDFHRTIYLRPTSLSRSLTSAFNSGFVSSACAVSVSVPTQALQSAQISTPSFSASAKFRAAMSVVWRTSSDLTGNPQQPKVSRSLKCIPNSRAVSLADNS